jgi:ABC-2 type transport system ATP-binding protein
VQEVPPALAAFGAALEGNRRLTLRYQPSETRVTEILAAVDKTGLIVADISTHEPDLEDLFLELTAGAGRGG